MSDDIYTMRMNTETGGTEPDRASDEQDDIWWNLKHDENFLVDVKLIFSAQLRNV